MSGFDVHGWATEPPSTSGGVLSGTGATGPQLSIPQDQAWSLPVAVKDANGQPIDLAGKTVVFEFGLGVSGGGAVIGAKPSVIFARNGVNRSPSNLGLADVALVPADTINLAAGAGYVYAVKTVDGGGNLIAYVFTESPAVLVASPPGG